MIDKEHLQSKIKDLMTGYTAEELQNAIADVGKVKGRQRVKEGTHYFNLDNCGLVGTSTERLDQFDAFKFNAGNYYHSRAEAGKARDKQLATQRVIDEIERLNDGWVPDWSSPESKYYVYMQHDGGGLKSNISTYKQRFASNLYLSCEDAASDLATYHESDLKLMLGIK